jgi:hypothetical protein
MSINTILTTSLAEIHLFNPCVRGWLNILNARNPQCDADYQTQFPLVDCLASNSISDVCWLIGKRRKEIQICVRFAKMCADSVKDLNNGYSNAAVNAAATVATVAAVNAATVAAANATVAAVNAVNAAAIAAANAVAYNKQKELNKQFLIQCINEFNPE